MTILKGDEDGFSYFSLISVILFSNQDRACVKQQSYKHPMKIKLQRYNAFCDKCNSDSRYTPIADLNFTIITCLK